jgi:WD40 repeat protein/serine/threonine protein kinase
MTERDICAAASAHADPAARAAFLDEACAGDTALRARVEQLLQAVPHTPPVGDGITRTIAPVPEEGGGATRTMPPHANEPEYAETRAPDEWVPDPELKRLLSPPSEEGSPSRLDHYEVLGVVGRGGMGVVFEAHDTRLRRVVALKLLAPALAAVGTARKRFAREAQSAAAVRDEHVVKIHAAHEDAAVPYLVMEFVSGITLEDRIRKEGPLPVREVVRIGLQAARGLATAHARGLVHRDVKPGNILLEDGSQRVKLTDFGLARAADDASISRSGVIAGTPMYMSPEQAKGDKVDHRSDLFSLGSVLYTLCTGRPAFRAESTVAVLTRVCDDDPRPIREVNADVPKWVCAVVGKLMAKDPADRFQSAAEVADLFARYLAHLENPDRVPPPPPVRGVRVRHRRRARRLVVGLVAVVAMVALGVAGYQAFRPKAENPVTQTPPEVNPLPDWKPPTAEELAARPSPLDGRTREQIAPGILALAGGGGPGAAPPELVAVLDAARFQLPKAGLNSWMAQDREGKFLAVPNADVVAVFDARTGELVRTLAGSDRIYAVAFSPDGKFLAGANWVGAREDKSNTSSFRIWDLSTGELTSTIPSDAGWTWSLAYSPDGKRLVASADKGLRVWDVATGQVAHSFPGGYLWQFGLSPDGKRAAYCDPDSNTVHVVNPESGERVGILEGFTIDAQPEPHQDAVRVTVFSPDGKWLATGNDKELQLWDAEKLELVKQLDTPAGWVAFEPGGRTLLTAKHDQNGEDRNHVVTRWDLTTFEGKPLPPLDGRPGWTCFHLSPDGKTLFSLLAHDLTGGDYELSVRAYDAATGKELFPSQGHSGQVWAVAASPDGRTIASGGVDGTVRLWDLAGWKAGDPQPPARVLTGHTATVYAVAFSPDGKLVASASQNGNVRFWDVATGEAVRSLQGEASRIPTDLAFSADGKLLTVGDEDGSVRLWDVASGEEKLPLRWHNGHVNSVAFSPDNRFLASAGRDDRKVYITDLKTMQRVQTLGPPGDQTGRADVKVAFGGDGRTLAYGGWDDTIRMWNLIEKKETVLTGWAAGLDGLAVDPTGRFVAATRGGVVRFWDKNSPARSLPIGAGLFGGMARHVAFTPEGRYLVVAGGDGTISTLRTPTPPPPPYEPGPPRKVPDAAELAKRRSPLDALKQNNLPPGVAAVLGDSRFRLPKAGQNSWMAMDREGKFLAVPNADVVVLFDARTGELVRTLTGQAARMYAVAFSPDGKHLAGAGWVGEWDKVRTCAVNVWNLTTGEATASIASDVGWPWSTGFSPDGKRLIIGGEKELEVRDASTGKVLHSFPASQLWQLGISPDGQSVAYGDAEPKTACVINLETGEPIGTLKGFTDNVRVTAFSPDGKWLATGNDKELLLWDAEKLELVKRLDTPAGWVAFEPGGKTLLTAKHDQTGEDRDHVVTRWDLATFEGKPLPSLSKRAGWVMYQHSPDGKTLFSLLAHGPAGEIESTVRAYDAATGKPLNEPGHSGPVWSVAPSPDGTRLAAGSDDGTVRVWDLATGKQLHSIFRPGPAYSVAFSPDGKTLAAHWNNGPGVLYDAVSGVEVRTLAGDFAAFPGRQMPFSPDGTLLAAAGSDGLVRVWEVSSGTLRRMFPVGTGQALAAAFSPDGKVIATGSESGTVTLWDMASGWQVGILPRQRGYGVMGIDFHPDGRTVAVAGLWRGDVIGPDSPKYAFIPTDGPNKGQAGQVLSKMYTWQLEAGQQYRFVLTSLDEKLAPLLVVDEAGDGKQLHSAHGVTTDGRFRAEVTLNPTRATTCKIIACAESGTGWFELRVHRGEKSTDWLGVGFVPVYDLATGKETHRVPGHDSGVRSCEWRADGKLLVTAGDDGTVRAWDMATNSPFGHHSGVMPGSVHGVAFTPEGRYVAATSPNGEIRIFRIPEPPPPYDPGPARPVPGPQAVASRPAASDALKRDDIPPVLLKHVGGGDPARVPPEVVAVLGDARFRLPKAGQNSWMAMDREGKFLAVPNADVVAVFDARTGELVHTLTGHSGRVYAVAFSPDGMSLAAGNWPENDKPSSIKVWNLTTGEVTATIATDASTIWSLAYGPDGKRLVGCCGNGLRVWELSTGKTVHSFPGTHAWQLGLGTHAWQLGLSPDGKRAAYPDAEGKTVRVVDPESGEQVGTLTGFADVVRTTQFSPDGKWLATGNDKELFLWDAEKLELVKKLDTPGGWLAFEPGGKTLLTAKHDQNGEDRNHVVTRWDLTTFDGKPLPPLDTRPGWTVFQLSPDGTTLYSNIVHSPGGWTERLVRAYDAATGKELFPRQGHTGQVWSVAFSRDGKRLASVSSDPGVQLWDMATGKPDRVLPNEQGFWSVAFSADGKLIAAGEIEGAVVLYDATTGEKRRTLPAPKSQVRAVTFSPDGSLVAGTTRLGVVHIWETGTGHLRHTLLGRGSTNVWSWSVAFTADGKTLATGWDRGEVVLFDVATGWEVGYLRIGVDAVRRLCFHPDGRSLGAVGTRWTSSDATVGADQTLTFGVWDLATWKQTRRMAAPGREIDKPGAPTRQELGCIDAAWREDGLLMATCGGSDGTVRLWSTDGKPDRDRVIRLFPPGTDWLHGLAMSPDGRHLATANPDGTVTILRLAKPGEVFEP